MLLPCITLARRTFSLLLAGAIVLTSSPVSDARTPDPVCAGAVSAVPEVQEYIDTQCAVETQLFGDDAAPSTGYLCEEMPGKAGEYKATDCYQRTVWLDLVSSFSVPVRQLYPAAFAEGDEFSCLWGWIKGASGKVPVVLSAIHKPSFMNGGTGTVLTVVKILTNADIEQVAQCERILAGARVVNSFTGKSKRISQMAGSFTAFADTSDLSTLYSNDTDSGTGDSTADCVNIAYQRFAAAQKANGKNLAICLASAATNYAYAVMGCITPMIFPSPATVAVMLVCEGLAIGFLAHANSLCEASFRVNQNLNIQNLLLDLQACGVHVSQT